jgi:pimeloyl-ACP methyl ester carboxylesterase
MSTVTLDDGATIWFERQGSGPPLLQIHGSAFGHRNFEKLTPLMSKRFEVIDFDLPGYGESHGGVAPKGFDGLAERVADLIEALGYDRVHVHGTSFGAMVALSLAARRPARVDKLVLSCFLLRYDNAARMMRGTWKRAAVETSMAAVAEPTSVAGFARSFYDRPEAPAQLESMREAFLRTTPEAFVAATETIEATDLSPLSPAVRGPVLLLAGAEDNMTPFAPAESGIGMAHLALEHPDWQSEILDFCGHYLVIEQPELAAGLVSSFLANDVSTGNC